MNNLHTQNNSSSTYPKFTSLSVFPAFGIGFTVLVSKAQNLLCILSPSFPPSSALPLLCPSHYICALAHCPGPALWFLASRLHSYSKLHSTKWGAKSLDCPRFVTPRLKTFLGSFLPTEQKPAFSAWPGKLSVWSLEVLHCHFRVGDTLPSPNLSPFPPTRAEASISFRKLNEWQSLPVTAFYAADTF